MRQLTLCIFWSVFTMALLFPGYGSCSDSQDLVQQGRDTAFGSGTPTVQGLIDADTLFQAAIISDPSNQQAHFFQAITRVLVPLAQQGENGFSTIRNIMEAFGFSWQGAPLPFPLTETPSGASLHSYVAGSFLELINASLADLDAVDNTFSVTLMSNQDQELFPEVTIDYTDVLTLKTMLNTIKTFVNAVADFDNDGKSDILWRNTANGSNAVWLMNGTSYTNTIALKATPNTAWTLAGIADFNSDGKPDILWRNTVNGANLVWFMDGTTFTAPVAIRALSNTSWVVAATADFNDDGKPDILWRNTVNGKNMVWLMNGTTPTGSADIRALSNTSWAIAGTADFNNDGKTDILWRHGGTGKNTVWLMNGTTYAGSAVIRELTNPAWTIADTLDFNGDGKPDILWRHSETGKNTVWFMDGITFTGSTSISPLGDTVWTIANH